MTVECTMYLTSTDIATMDFRNLIYWKGMNWRLIEIKDYAVGQSKLTRVTLRRVLPFTPFTVSTFTPTHSDDPTALTAGEVNASLAYPLQMLDPNLNADIPITPVPDNPFG